MAEFWFIRHGESEGNAGLPAISDQATLLTPKGMQQAKNVTRFLQTPPDLFVISPYLRTSQTAQPTLKKFSSIPVETWPIHEYSYLNAKQYSNSTKKSRQVPSLKYFLRLDTDLNLGPGAESFNEFIQRVDVCLDRIKKLDREFIVLFGHGWFIKATLWRLFQSKASLEEQKTYLNEITRKLPSSTGLLNTTLFLEKKFQNPMFPFLLFSAAVIIPNTGIVKFKLESETGQIKFLAFESTLTDE